MGKHCTMMSMIHVWMTVDDELPRFGMSSCWVINVDEPSANTLLYCALAPWGLLAVVVLRPCYRAPNGWYLKENNT